jgi:hypothetical protein
MGATDFFSKDFQKAVKNSFVAPKQLWKSYYATARGF